MLRRIAGWLFRQFEADDPTVEALLTVDTDRSDR